MTTYTFSIRRWQELYSTRPVAVLLVLSAFLITFWQDVYAAFRPDALTPTNHNSLELENYQLIAKPVALPYVSDNASGITYNRDTQTLFAVINSPESIVEMDKTGKLLRTITLEGFNDTEGLVYIGHQRFVILEERRRNIVIISVTNETDHIERRGLRSLAMPATGKPNKGFEGIAADAANGRLFVVNEKQPLRLLQIDGFINHLPTMQLKEPWNLQLHSLGNRDIAGLHFDAKTGHLLLLSDESRKLSETDMQGNQLSQIKLKKGHGRLESHIPQAEGVTLDDEGNLYILSEPNLFYRFGKKAG